MPAGVVEGADLSVGAAHQKHRLGELVEAQIVAVRRQLALVCGEEPAPAEHGLPLAAKKRGSE